MIARARLLLVLAVLATTSCATVRGGGPPDRPAAQLAGEWTATIAPASGGEFAVRMTFEADGRRHWSGHSRPGALSEVIGWRKATLGRMLGRTPPHNAMVVLTGVAERHGDSVRVSGRIESPFLGRHDFTGALAGGRLVAELRGPNTGWRAGRFEAVRHTGNAPVRDYRALAANVRRGFEQRLYDQRLLQRPEWRRFLEHLDDRIARAQDDADVLLAFHAVRRSIPMSHLELVRDPARAALPLDSMSRLNSDPRDLVTLTFPAPGVAMLRVSRWIGVAGVVKEAFERIDSVGAHTLVLDIRGNRGGDATSMQPIAHLIADSLDAGVFLGRKWYVENAGPPNAEQRARLRVVSDTVRTFALLDEGREHGAVRGVIPPAHPRFTGTVYLLTDRGSGSASEPLAHVMKAHGLATLVGDSTAGAMLSAPPTPVGDGWLLILPELDYFTADGVRLEGNPVTPHVAVPSRDALLAVAERVAQRDAYAGALLMALAHFNAGRTAESDSVYRALLAQHPDSTAVIFGLARAHQERKEWDDAFALYERILAREPDHTAAIYQFGRTAALSGDRTARGIELLRRYLEFPVEPGAPSHGAAHWRIGMLLEQQGDLEAARREFGIAVRLEPDEPGFFAAYRDAWRPTQ